MQIAVARADRINGPSSNVHRECSSAHGRFHPILFPDPRKSRPAAHAPAAIQFSLTTVDIVR
ncbi:MAG: hypothetical protein MZU95_10500 [Desulfomicrobium escambiense]|nr:hypothetical protein [Desulfomicrobium escambiense]